MLLGYARVCSTDRNADHQIDALRRAGVAAKNIHLDPVGGAQAPRPQLDLVLTLLREGDTLVITRLDRLGRSVLHLIALGAELRERGVGLKVLEQGIDTATVEGRAMFGMFTVLADLRREQAITTRRDRRAAARGGVRGRGRPYKLDHDQVDLVLRLHAAGEHTVAQIADLVGVRRTTIYRYLNKPPTDGADTHPANIMGTPQVS